MRTVIVVKNALMAVERRSWILCVLLTAAIPWILPIDVSAQSYSVHALEEVVVDGLQYRTFAKDLTSAAEGFRIVVGYAQLSNADNQPVLWTVDSSGNSLHALLHYPAELAGAVAVGVNDYGQIIGGGLVADGTNRDVGLYWPDAVAAPIVVPTPAGEHSSQVLRINDSGIVAGYVTGATGSRAVVWRILEDDSIVEPLVLPTRPKSSAGNDAALSVGATVNNITEIVGRSAGAAVVWRVRTSGNSLTLEGSAEVLESTGTATDISSLGAICGNDRSRSVIWEPLTGKKRTKTQLNYATSLFSSPGQPSAITDGGTVVGTANLKGINGPAGRRVVIWTNRTAPMRTLESLTVGGYPFLYLDTASAISGSGEVVGYGWQGSATGYQAFIAIPAAP